MVYMSRPDRNEPP